MYWQFIPQVTSVIQHHTTPPKLLRKEKRIQIKPQIKPWAQHLLHCCLPKKKRYSHLEMSPIHCQDGRSLLVPWLKFRQCLYDCCSGCCWLVLLFPSCNKHFPLAFFFLNLLFSPIPSSLRVTSLPRNLKVPRFHPQTYTALHRHIVQE